MISIVTPSFRQLDWLQLAMASVADQGIETEHIVQDACSDGIETFIEQQVLLSTNPRYRALLSVEEDAGMYDAINRGLSRARGDICAYLNCDEQYLPGALSRVVKFFDNNPGADILFGHTVIVDRGGNFIASRQAIIPGKYHTWVSNNLAILTCATFFRRHLFEERNLWFNCKLKDVGDAEWVLRLLKAKVRMVVLPYFTSAFAETGQNLDLSSLGTDEKAHLVASAPLWVRALRGPIIAYHRGRKLLAGAYFQKAFSYDIYTLQHPTQRTTFHVPHPTSRWRR